MRGQSKMGRRFRTGGEKVSERAISLEKALYL
jgi:hypothetical protein